jgi:predicted PurR-regulated permease PerM
LSSTSLVMLLLFGLALYGGYVVYAPFLLPMAVAMLLNMATYSLTKRLTRRFGRRGVSAVVMTLLMTLTLFAPLIYIVTTGATFVSQVDKATIREMLESIRHLPWIQVWFEDLGSDYFSVEKVFSGLQSSAHYLTSLGSAGLGFVKNMFLVVLFYFVINLYGDKMFVLIRQLIPISQLKSARMIHEVSSTMEVVFYSTIATAVLEGFLFGVFVGTFGFNGLLLGILYGFASLVPVIGGALLWAPLSLYAWSQSDLQTAWMVALYSIVVISIVADTFVKPLIIKIIQKDLLKGSVEINEFVIFFAIIAGISSFGIWGMILGPAVTSFLVAMTRIYIDFSQNETIALSRWSGRRGAIGSSTLTEHGD